jgi:transposase
MSAQRFTPEFKQEAVRQIVERGYSVAEVSARVGVSAHSLYKWVKAVTPDKSEKQATELVEAKSEILRLRAQLRRTEEERDILEKAARYFAKEPEWSTASSTTIGTNSASRRCAGCYA